MPFEPLLKYSDVMRFPWFIGSILDCTDKITDDTYRRNDKDASGCQMEQNQTQKEIHKVSFYQKFGSIEDVFG